MTVVRSGGQLLSISQPAVTLGWGYPAHSVELYGGLVATYGEIWRSQPEVRTCVDFLARNIAQCAVHVYRRVSDTDRVRADDSGYAQALLTPNPFTTPFRLVRDLVSDLATYDNALMVKLARADGGVGLVRVPPWSMHPVGDSWLMAEGYELRGNRGRIDYGADEVVHFRGWSPMYGDWGVSPIETLRQTLAEAYSASLYREQLWRSGARIATVITRPAEAPPWSGEARRRFRGEWGNRYAGEGAEAGGTPILEDGMDIKPIGETSEQAQYVESRKLTRTEVAAAYHIPPPFVGDLEHATFSNITEQHKQLYVDTLGPWFRMIEDDLDLQLGHEEWPEDPTLYAEFNIQEKLRGSFEDTANALRGAVGAPYLTRNEARAMQNLPRLDGGDSLVLPLNVAPDAGTQPAPAPALNASRVAAALATHFERQRVYIRGREADAARLLGGGRWAEYLAGELVSAGVPAEPAGRFSRALVAATARALDAPGIDPRAALDAARVNRSAELAAKLCAGDELQEVA